MAAKAPDYNPATRWSPENFERCRTMRKHAKQTGKPVGKPEMLPPLRGHNLNDYGIEGARFNPASLSLPAGMSEDEWQQAGQKVVAVCESAAWWVGDWMNYGTQTFGRSRALDLGVQATGYTRGTLCTYASVASRVPPEQRVAGVSFGKHEAVMTLQPEDRIKLLTEAQELGLNENQILELVREEKGQPRRFNQVRKGTRRVTLFLEPAVYEQLLENGGGHSVQYLIPQIIAEWLAARPPKLCECGCGKPVPIAARTHSDKGYVKGKPTRFIQGHGERCKNGNSTALAASAF